MVFNTKTYDESNKNYNINYDTYISGNNYISINGTKYYNNKFGKIMASFVVDAGDTVLGGNVIVTDELNCYGNISSKVNSKLNVCTADQINTITVSLSNVNSFDTYQFIDLSNNVIKKVDAVLGNQYKIITLTNSISNLYIINRQVSGIAGIFLNAYNATSNTTNYGLYLNLFQLTILKYRIYRVFHPIYKLN